MTSVTYNVGGVEADGPLDTGLWSVTPAPGYTGLKIVSGNIYSNDYDGSTASENYWIADSFSNDQMATAKGVYGFSGIYNGIWLRVRSQPGAVDVDPEVPGYRAQIRSVSGADEILIEVFHSDGTYGLLDNTTGVSVNDGHDWAFEAVGTVLTVYKDGVSVFSYDDTSNEWTSGSMGVGIYTVGSNTPGGERLVFQSWAGEDFGAPPDDDIDVQIDTEGAITVAGQTVDITLPTEGDVEIDIDTAGSVAVTGQSGIDATVYIEVGNGQILVEGQTIDTSLGDVINLDFSIDTAGAVAVLGQDATVSFGVTILNGAIVVAGQTITATGHTPLAVTFHGHYKRVASISPIGKTKWVDYIPVQYVYPTEAKVGTWDDDGGVAVRTVAASGTPWTDYIPVVEVGSSPNRYDDAGYLRVVETTD